MSSQTANIEKSIIDEVDSEECAQFPFYRSIDQLDIMDIVHLRYDQDEDAPRHGVVMGVFYFEKARTLAVLWPDGSITKHFPESLKKVGPID